MNCDPVRYSIHTLTRSHSHLHKRRLPLHTRIPVPVHSHTERLHTRRRSHPQVTSKLVNTTISSSTHTPSPLHATPTHSILTATPRVPHSPTSPLVVVLAHLDPIPCVGEGGPVDTTCLSVLELGPGDGGSWQRGSDRSGPVGGHDSSIWCHRLAVNSMTWSSSYRTDSLRISPISKCIFHRNNRSPTTKVASTYTPWRSRNVYLTCRNHVLGTLPGF